MDRLNLLQLALPITTAGAADPRLDELADTLNLKADLLLAMLYFAEEPVREALIAYLFASLPAVLNPGQPLSEARKHSIDTTTSAARNALREHPDSGDAAIAWRADYVAGNDDMDLSEEECYGVVLLASLVGHSPERCLRKLFTAPDAEREHLCRILLDVLKVYADQEDAKGNLSDRGLQRRAKSRAKALTKEIKSYILTHGEHSDSGQLSTALH